MKFTTTTASLLSVMLLATTAPQVNSANIIGESNLFVDEGPYWADNVPVRIKIDPTLHGSDVDHDLTFNVYYENFAFEPQEATSLPSQYANGKKRANAGHLHLYATWLGDNSNSPSDLLFWNHTNVFVGASNNEVSPGVLEYSITLPELGEWAILAEAQYDDHTPRTRMHPQQLGAWDVVYVNVVPEPGAAILLGAGMLSFVSRRRRR